MGQVSRFIPKSALAGLMLTTALVFAAPHNAYAQFCDIDAIPAIDEPLSDDIWSAAADEEENLWAGVNDIDLTIQAGDAEITAAIAGLDIDMQLLFGTLAGTTTNNATMQAGTESKGMDYQAATAYTQKMQEKQADEQKESGAGNLAYMATNLCQQTTLVSGRSTVADAVKSEKASYNGLHSQARPPTSAGVPSVVSSTTVTCTTCGAGENPSPAPPSVIDALFTTKPINQRLRYIVQSASPFFGSSDCASVSSGGSSSGSATSTDGNSYKDPVSGTEAEDTSPATHMDVSVLDLREEGTYSDMEIHAHDQLATYLAGLPPEVPANTPSFCANHSASDPAILAHLEKLAFYNLSNEAMQDERASHAPVNTGAGAAASAVIQASGLANPAFTPSGGSGPEVSLETLENTLYEQAADNPQFLGNVSTMTNNAALRFIAGEMLLLNRMEYEHYELDKERWKVESASLNLQQRSFNFNGQQ